MILIASLIVIASIHWRVALPLSALCFFTLLWGNQAGDDLELLSERLAVSCCLVSLCAVLG